MLTDVLSSHILNISYELRAMEDIIIKYRPYIEGCYYAANDRLPVDRRLVSEETIASGMHKTCPFVPLYAPTLAIVVIEGHLCEVNDTTHYEKNKLLPDLVSSVYSINMCENMDDRIDSFIPGIRADDFIELQSLCVAVITKFKDTTGNAIGDIYRFDCDNRYFIANNIGCVGGYRFAEMLDNDRNKEDGNGLW